MLRGFLLFIAAFYSSILMVQAQYPFSLPSSFSVTANVQTAQQEEFNDLLLGYNIMGFSSTTEKNLIRQFNPITVRFPHGLFSNWYDWEQDKARVYGTETFQYRRPDGSYRMQTIDHLSSIKLMDSHNIKVGIDGLTSLNSEKKSAIGRGYDMLWTFNMSADGTNFNNGCPVSVARYRDLKRRGFEVKAVEMGNENFYPGQRSSIIPNTEDYIARARSMSSALKGLDPNVRVSVPMLRRANTANPNWNADLAANSGYFDAVSVHTYIGADPDDASNSDEAYGTALTAREALRKSIDDYAGKVAPGKPIWLSEWGVKSGGANAVSALGMADCYLFLSENQKRYERANWFSVNGKLNSFLVWEDYVAGDGTTRQRIKYPLQKTAFGATYEIVRSIMENSTSLKTTVNSPQLSSNANAVNARAFVRNGKTYLLAVNLTNKSVPFTVQLDGSNYAGSFTHRALSFNWMGHAPVFPIDTDPLNTIKNGSGSITLPKFSVNTILLKDAHVNVLSVSVTAPKKNQVFHVGDVVRLEADATATSGISKVNFRVNGKFLKSDTKGPFATTWKPTAAGTYTIDAVLYNKAGKKKNANGVTVRVLAKTKSATMTSYIEPFTSKEISVYPNPVEDQFVIDLGNVLAASVNIYDGAGKRIYTKENVSGVLLLQKKQLGKSGLYLIKIIDDERRMYSQKLIVE